MEYEDYPDNEPRTSLEMTILDEARIEDLELDEKMEAESGDFYVVHTNFKSLCNPIYVVSCKIGKNVGQFIFTSKEDVIQFLQNN